MKFYAKDAFTKLDPTTGTIQNNSLIYDVEVSDKAEDSPARSQQVHVFQSSFVCALLR